MSQIEASIPEQSKTLTKPNSGDKSFSDFIRRFYIPILLGCCIVLAFLLRIYDITGIPNGLNQDEAVNGVDAYSLGQTLRDHHGNFLPVLLESYEDWASSLLTYLTIPFVWVLGLTEFAVRLPMVLIGTASVFMMYLYVKRLTNRPNLGLLAAFLLAVMPWHIIASRWAIPPGTVPFLVLLLMYFFLRVGPTETKVWKFGAIAFCAALLVYAYPTQKMFIPLLLGIFFLAEFFNKVPFKHLIKKYLVIGGIFLVLTSPIFYLAFFGGAKYNLRFNTISIFAMSNEPVKYFFLLYFNYFNPVRLFDWMGNYFFLAIFNYLGLAACIHKLLFRKSPFNIITRQQAIILVGWWVIAPIPASFTYDQFNPLRFMHGLPEVIIFSIVGIAVTANFLNIRLKNIRLEKILYITVVSFSLLFLCIYSFIFFGWYKQDSQEDFQYGIGQFSDYLIQHKADFDNVTVDSHINQPYIFYLFFSKQDPHTYNYDEINANRGNTDPTVRGIPRLGNYTYAKISPETILGAREILDVKDANNFVWYKVYAKDRQWFVVMNYYNYYDPPI